MEAALFVSIFVALLVAIFLPLSGKRWTTAEDEALERRLADARMNAGLLRFNV